MPAVLVMGAIYLGSSRSPDQLPVFGPWDFVVKKLGHILEYGVLAVSYCWALCRHAAARPEPFEGCGKDRPADRKVFLLAGGLAMLYAASDELHQSLVPGRHATLQDILLFGLPGVAVGILACVRWRRRIGQASASSDIA
jgi:hypothetical protein